MESTRVIHNTRGRFLLIFLSIIIIMFSSLMYAVATDKNDMALIEITVNQGDNLWNIASKYYPDSKDIRKTIYDIKKLNDITNHIYAGQTLTLAIPVQQEDYKEIPYNSSYVSSR